MMRTRGSRRAHATGQSMVEFVIIVPVLLLLIFGILQFAQVYIAKSTLDLAAYDGVRAGTMNNAQMGAIECGIARGLLPLYGGNETPSVSALAELVTSCNDGVGPPRYIAAFSKASRRGHRDGQTASSVDYGAMDWKSSTPRRRPSPTGARRSTTSCRFPTTG